MRRLSIIHLLSIIMLFIVLGFTSNALLADRQEPQTNSIDPTEVSAPLDEQASSTSLPWYIDLPPTERAIEETKEAIRQADIQTLTAITNREAAPALMPTIDFSDGTGVRPISTNRHPAGAGDIIDIGLHLLFRDNFDVNNVWTAFLEDVHVLVYAGSDHDTPTQGGVYVQWGELGESHPTRNNMYYPAPIGIGALRIIDATDTRLVLATVDGTTIEFEVLSGTYESEARPAVPSPLATEAAYPAP